MKKISTVINGQQHDLEVEPRKLLVHLLRDRLHLTGTHVGCDTSQCGACTVRIDGVAVKSCTVLAVQVNGAQIETIEALADGNRLDPVQRAFARHHALQCGFCTPGMVMAAHELLGRHPNPSDQEIRHGLEGNLCRCTGYHNIVEAIKEAAAELA